MKDKEIGMDTEEYEDAFGWPNDQYVENMTAELLRFREGWRRIDEEDEIYVGTTLLELALPYRGEGEMTE